MSLEEKIVHKQTFQNAQQIVEVLIKSKPKPKLGLKTKGKPRKTHFNRNCLLKKELEKQGTIPVQFDSKEAGTEAKASDEKENYLLKNNEISKKSHKKHKTYQLKKHESDKKKSHITEKHILPPNTTWREFLESFSSQTISDSQTTGSEYDLNTYNPKQMSGRESRGISHRENTYKASLNSYSDRSRHTAGLISHNKVDQSTQTSFKTKETTNVYQTDSNAAKSRLVSRPAHLSSISNQGKSSVDQTHSPFGESALRLLHQLRERLQSLGDCEGTELVTAIESYLSVANSNRSGNREGAFARSPDLPFFPPVFPTPAQDPQRNSENETLKRVVEEQNRRLKEQEETIQELRSLSAKLLTYHEQLTEQLAEARRDQEDDPNLERCKVTREASHDSGIEFSSNEGLQKTIKLVTSERDALLKETRSQREVIVNLELKLSRCLNEENLLKDSNKYLFSRAPSRHNEAPVAIDCPSQNHRSKEGKGGSSSMNPVHLLRHTPTSSDTDSAYEEKCSKSSRAPSKTSPLHYGGCSKQDNEVPNMNGTDPVLRAFDGPSYRHDQAVAEHVSSATHKSVKENSVNHCLPAQNLAPITEAVTRIHPYGPLPSKVGGAVVLPPDQLSLSSVSEWSNGETRLSNCPAVRRLEEREAWRNAITIDNTSTQKPSALYKTLLSETPILVSSHKYLESTHVADRGKMSSSAVKHSTHFDLQVSTLEPSSDTQIEGIPEPCSVTMQTIN